RRKSQSSVCPALYSVNTTRKSIQNTLRKGGRLFEATLPAPSSASSGLIPELESNEGDSDIPQLDSVPSDLDSRIELHPDPIIMASRSRSTEFYGTDSESFGGKGLPSTGRMCAEEHNSGPLDMDFSSQALGQSTDTHAHTHTYTHALAHTHPLSFARVKSFSSKPTVVPERVKSWDDLEYDDPPERETMFEFGWNAGYMNAADLEYDHYASPYGSAGNSRAMSFSSNQTGEDASLDLTTGNVGDTPRIAIDEHFEYTGTDADHSNHCNEPSTSSPYLVQHDCDHAYGSQDTGAQTYAQAHVRAQAHSRRTAIKHPPTYIHAHEHTLTPHASPINLTRTNRKAKKILRASTLDSNARRALSSAANAKGVPGTPQNRLIPQTRTVHTTHSEGSDVFDDMQAARAEWAAIDSPTGVVLDDHTSTFADAMNNNLYSGRLSGSDSQSSFSETASLNSAFSNLNIQAVTGELNAFNQHYNSLLELMELVEVVDKKIRQFIDVLNEQTFQDVTHITCHTWPPSTA
ncbi:hypothetical protein SARC_13001, partial [Sphaeroforma arctica JP610]